MEMVRVGELEFPKPAYGPETAERIIEIVQMYPESHNQAHWEYPGNNVCGTTRCIAGWVDYIHPELRLRHRKYYETCVCIECVSNPESDWLALGAEGLNLEPKSAAALFTTTTAAGSIKALGYVAKGEPIDWDEVK